MTDPMLEKLVRFQHPDRTLGYTRSLTDSTRAALFGTDEDALRATMQHLDAQRAAAARELAADPQVAADLARVPFSPGQRLVAIGESATADRLSWFEILRTLLHSERPDLDLRLENLAVSGATTTQALAAAPALRRQAGDWVFCMLGSNDAQRFGTPDGPRLVSPTETLRNLRELRAQAHLGEHARWVWVAPTPLDEALVAQFPFFRAAAITWTNRDVAELTAALRNLEDLMIDTADATTGADPFLDDGLHPSLATQKAIAARTLASIHIRRQINQPSFT
jgi:acyl-CoA thioesterase-1